MPDRFATAVWVNPAAMRQCRTVFANATRRCFSYSSKYGADFLRSRKARTRHHGLSR